MACDVGKPGRPASSRPQWSLPRFGYQPGSVMAGRFPEYVRTERLVLRRWRTHDRAAFERIWAEPEVWAALRPGALFDPGYGSQRFDHHLNHWERHGFGLWTIAEREDGEIAGWVGVNQPGSPEQFATDIEVGWTLRGGFRGRGFACEGAAAAITAGFHSLGVERLISLIAPANAASIAVARRLGMHLLTEVQYTPTEGRSPRLSVYTLDRHCPTTSRPLRDFMLECR